MYTLHPDKLVSVSRILDRRRQPPVAQGDNLIERLARKLHAERAMAYANPVGELGREFRHVNFPQPRPVRRLDGVVMIPGGPPASRIPAGKI